MQTLNIKTILLQQNLSAKCYYNICTMEGISAKIDTIQFKQKDAEFRIFPYHFSYLSQYTC